MFIAWHGYWALGGDFGFGDQESAFPDAGRAFTAVVATLFAAGLAVPLAVARGIGPRRALIALLWIGAGLLGAARALRAGRRRAPLRRPRRDRPDRAQRRAGARHARTRRATRSGRPSASTRSSPLGGLLFARAARARAPPPLPAPDARLGRLRRQRVGDRLRASACAAIRASAAPSAWPEPSRTRPVPPGQPARGRASSSWSASERSRSCAPGACCSRAGWSSSPRCSGRALRPRTR